LEITLLKHLHMREAFTQSEILHCTQIVELNCNIVYRTNTNPHAQTNMVLKTNSDLHISYDDKTNLEDKFNAYLGLLFDIHRHLTFATYIEYVA
jgi:hypothetical protein